ncbi:MULTISPECIES: hypothetical protein [Bacillus]|uniref:Competence protein n=1 Tax=Bacillus capparidis TaxID=1840411 RepID=A0ABS4CRE6_9BACI|nr:MULTISPECIES: hypothetical protein [Bacillus]MBP1079600.1 hypothetical protein [Bacillus capparidis]MED1095001.1 hypothetical protein [Bacillus capparidis]
MGKRNKSKRFVQQGKDAVSLHDARFPYRSTLEESIRDQESTIRGT